MNFERQRRKLREQPPHRFIEIMVCFCAGAIIVYAIALFIAHLGNKYNF